MIQRLLLFVSVLLVGSGTAGAQNWMDMGAFPDSTMFWRGAHGLAVDAEGKVWLSQYYPPEPIAIHVFNMDGTKAMDPINTFTYVKDGETMTDTLVYAGAVPKRITGVKADHNGDIIVMVGQGVSLMFRLNHKTGEVMNRVNLESDTFTGSPASPGIDGAGNIYVAPVSANAPISIFNSDFRWIGNVSNSSPGIGRAVEVSEDGNSVYWSAFTHRGTYKYHREDEFSSYDSLGLVHEGLIAQGSVRHPTTGYIWLGHGAAENIALDTTGMFMAGSELTAFAIDPMQEDMIVDSLKFNSPFKYCGAGLNRDIRGIGFSHDGVYAYLGAFNVLQAVQADGQCGWLFQESHRGFPYKKFMRGEVASIERDPTEIPTSFTLSQNYPNPFNPQTNIAFEMKDAGLATLKIYDVLGREVATLVDEHLIAGKYTATFTANDLPSGTYVYQLNVAGNRLSGKMMLVK